MDPLKTNDGKPYGPERYKSIVQERYFITKNSGVSYEDTGKMTPTERELYVSFILEEFAKTKEAMDKKLSEINANTKNTPRSRR